MSSYGSRVVCVVAILCSNVFAATETFQVGQDIEYRILGDERDPWPADEPAIQGKIIDILPDSRAYRVLAYQGTGGSRETIVRFWNARTPRNPIVNEYDPAWAAGIWEPSTGTAWTTTDTERLDESRSRITLERSMLALTGKLEIRGDETYIWIPSPEEAYQGRWERSEDREYVLVLKDARWGEDWRVGPYGKTNGIDTIRLHGKTLRYDATRVGERAGQPDDTAKQNDPASPRATQPENPPPSNPSPSDNKPVNPALSLKVGDRVLAVSRKADLPGYFPVTIEATRPGEYRIRFDGRGWGDDVVRWATPAELKRMGSDTEPIDAPHDAVGAQGDSPAPDNAAAASDGVRLRAGDRVLARSTWSELPGFHPATIIETCPGEYRVRFDGSNWGQHAERWASPDDLKMMGSDPKPIGPPGE